MQALRVPGIVAHASAWPSSVPIALRTRTPSNEQAATRRRTPCNQPAAADTQRRQTPRSEALSKDCRWSRNGDACVHTAEDTGSKPVTPTHRFRRPPWGVWNRSSVQPPWLVGLGTCPGHAGEVLLDNGEHAPASLGHVSIAGGDATILQPGREGVPQVVRAMQVESDEAGAVSDPVIDTPVVVNGQASNGHHGPE